MPCRTGCATGLFAIVGDGCIRQWGFLVKKFTIPCDFASVKAPFNIYVGEPRAGKHPLQHQSSWLSRERGGTIPPEVMDEFQKLLDISAENGVSFEELCVYARGETKDGDGPDDSTVEPAQA